MRYTVWLRDVLDPSPEPPIVKQTAGAMASFVDFATGCGTFSQRQLMRRLGMKDPTAVRERIRAVIESGLIVIIEKGRRFLGATRYGLAVPGEQADTRGESADLKSGAGPDPLLTEESPELDLFDGQDHEVVSGGSGPAPLSTADPTELKTTTPLSPLVTDQGGGGLKDLTETWGETTPPAPKPATTPTPPEPPASIDEPGPTPQAPTDPDDLRAAAEALDGIAQRWGLQAIYAPDVVDRLADATATGWPAEALAAHMANNPPGRIHDPAELLRDRLRRRGLPPGPGACGCAGCERWRREADAAAARERRHRDRTDDHGLPVCPEHDGRTRHLPTGRCEQCLLIDHPELAEPAPEVTGLPVRAETTVMVEQIRKGLSRRLSPTGGRR